MDRTPQINALASLCELASQLGALGDGARARLVLSSKGPTLIAKRSSGESLHPAALDFAQGVEMRRLMDKIGTGEACFKMAAEILEDAGLGTIQDDPGGAPSLELPSAQELLAKAKPRGKLRKR